MRVPHVSVSSQSVAPDRQVSVYTGVHENPEPKGCPLNLLAMIQSESREFPHALGQNTSLYSSYRHVLFPARGRQRQARRSLAAQTSSLTTFARTQQHHVDCSRVLSENMRDLSRF
ncbi:hypothetical protein BaRGS_00028604 [Batillaria attramentaria]|uniref:Uncharacterized protein n=1 Tax=Batillaria attramentaria TaxID=370345 RepID=A0ABD0JZG9_9CAEN